MEDDSTVFIQDIESALKSTEQRPSKKPAVLLVDGGEYGGNLFDLIDKNISVGRGPDNTIVLEIQGVSRCHFKLSLKSEGWALEDANSRNGTYLNNNKVEKPVILKKGDIIKISNLALKFLPQGDPERLNYDKLQSKANRDLHTGCYNKTYFNNALDLHFKRAKAAGIPISLILLDLDHFKKINDDYGHDAGDYVLKRVAEVIQKDIVRPNDIFARYGGEEFVILLLNMESTKSLEIAENLRQTLEALDFLYGKQKFTVTASIGVADYKKEISTSTDLFKRADNAVYKAKSKGRNNVQLYKD